MWDDYNILASYFYAGKKSLAEWFAQANAPTTPKVMVDSGAFTAFYSGKTIDVDKYMRWLADNADHIDYYINLDVVRDPVKTADAQTYMELCGFDPLPVWHIGSPWIELERLAERYDYVCIGEVARLSNKTSLLHHQLDHIFFLVGRGKRLHGLGLNGYRTLLRYPWASTDSTSWLNPKRFALAQYFSPSKQTTVRVEYGTMNRGQVVRLISADAKDIGFDISGLYEGDTICRDTLVRFVVASWYAAGGYQDHIREAWRDDYSMYAALALDRKDIAKVTPQPALIQ